MPLNINQYSCPDCKEPIASWVVRRPEFVCDSCGQGFLSNYRRSLKRSALLGLLFWLGGVGLALLMVDAWQMVLVFSIEFGGVLAFLLAYLVHRYSIHITMKSKHNKAVQEGVD
ncbi:MAG: hypothetical protein OQL27_02235 [Sedimenticola sp.]|nr:hypothetical protein [Sedimenticola sp.]